MRFGEKLDRLMTAGRLSERDVAVAVRVSNATVNRWKAKTIPRLDEAARLAAFLRVPLVYLADDTMDEVPEEEGLGDDERAVLDVFRALQPQLDKQKAIRALSAAAHGSPPHRLGQTLEGQAFDPQTALPERSPAEGAGRRRTRQG